MNFLPHLAARVVGTPLMVECARLETILSIIGPRVGIDMGALPPELANPVNSHGLITITPNGLAVVPIHGTLVKRAGAIDAASGLLSYAAVENMILEAATDPAVKAILMDIDSPGGEVGGVFDLAAMINEAKETKPIWAVADDAFSAAYLLASCADRIYLPQTAGVGSVGVIAVHVDESERDAKEGRQFTTVFAGARKNDFSSHEPLSDGARCNLQHEVDRLYGMFVGAVASNRNMTETAIRTTEAGLFFGGNAIQAGLADRVGTIRDALVDLSALLESPKTSFFHRAAQPPEHTTLEAIMPNDQQQTTDNPAAQPEPKAETPAPILATTPQPHGETVDLDKIRAEKEIQLRGEAQAIVDFCGLAGMPDLAGSFIAQGLNLENVRKELLSRRADGPDIQSQVMPGDGTRIDPKANLDDNPVVTSCRKMAQQHKMEG